MIKVANSQRMYFGYSLGINMTLIKTSPDTLPPLPILIMISLYRYCDFICTCTCTDEILN